MAGQGVGEGHEGGAWCELGDERERVDGRTKGIGHGALLVAQRGETRKGIEGENEGIGKMESGRGGPSAFPYFWRREVDRGEGSERLGLEQWAAGDGLGAGGWLGLGMGPREKWGSRPAWQTSPSPSYFFSSKKTLVKKRREG